MLTITLHSRKLARDFNFFARSGGGYVYLEEAGRPGLSGRQVCSGGGFVGDTIMCGATEASLERVARKWLRDHVAGSYPVPTPEERARDAAINAQLDAEDAEAARTRTGPYADLAD